MACCVLVRQMNTFNERIMVRDDMELNERTTSLGGRSRFGQSKISSDRVGKVNSGGKERNASPRPTIRDT